MKRIVLIIALLFVFSFGASAEIYDEQLNGSGIENIEIDDSVEQFFESEDISLYDTDWINKITAGNVFTFLFDTLKDEGKTPILTGAAILGVILLLAVARLFSEKAENEQMLSFVGTSLSAGAVLLPLFSVITAATRTLKAGAQFMLSFIPVYSTILYASGKPITSASSGALLLAAGEGVSWLSSYIITPLLSSYLAVSLCGNLSPAVNLSGVCEFMKKSASWALGLIMTIYLGILSVQTTVNSSADNLAVKTGKFMIGSFVPVVGGAVSEALTTVSSCMGLLRSSVGIYAIVVLALMLLPSLLQLLLWRVVLLLCSSAATVFECPKMTAILKSADSAVSFLIGILLICSVAFIISLTVLTTAGG